jgi:hypothetical protein
MYSMDQLTIIGFTGQDAETHCTSNGTLVTTLSVARKQSRKDGNGEWQSRTDWHRVVHSRVLLSTRPRCPRARTCWCKAPFAPASTRRTA